MIKKRIFKETGKVYFIGTKRYRLFPKPRRIKKIKPPKPQRKKTYWKKKADILLSKFIRSLDHCERCSSIKNLQCAHIITRSNLRLRYDIQNVLCLCAKCHLWWHKEPLEAIAWFNQDYKERAEYLLKSKNDIKKMTIDSYKEVIKDLSNYIPIQK